MSRKLSPINVNFSALNSPREVTGPNLKEFLMASPRLPGNDHGGGGSHRRNDALSKSLAISSTKGGSIKSSGGPGSQFGIVGTTIPSAREHRRRGLDFSHIQIKDIIESGEKCSNKIGSTYVPVLNRPQVHAFMKDEGKRDFVNAIQRANSIKLAANHYTIFDAGGFTSKDNLRKVRFAFSKEQKTSVID